MENMKYIRTKDGIFEVVKEDDEWVDAISNFERKMKCQFCIKKKGVLKQADTIEELCDGLIVEDKDNTNNWFVMDISEYESKDNVDKKYMVDRWNFYAFIKTDKGLA